jgi:hypothetical protein
MKPARRQWLQASAALPRGGGAARGPHAPPPGGAPAEVTAEITGARLLGSGTLRFMGLRVYDARLWAGVAAPGPDWQAAPFALELQYLRNLKGSAIAERSLKEMERQGEISAVDGERWLGNMQQLFPDVKPGDRITGVNLPGVGARFFLNGQARGELREVAFARLFFGIWLSPRTSEPAMREQLLGLKTARSSP